MIPKNPKGIIELGTKYIKCLIFGFDDNDNFKILSSSKSQSEGIHNGVVVNLLKAANSIRSCISAAEKNANVSLKKITVVVEQPEFLCTKFSKHRKIDGSKIDKTDIEFLLKEAKKEVNINDSKQSIIHIFNHNYIVDGKTFIEEPIDVYADTLSHEMTFVTMPKNNIKNINQTFIDCDIEVERYISCTFALAVKLLNNNQLEFGSVLIDMGFEKTSLGLFKNLALIHSTTLPIGVNHIAKDISKVCSLSLDESDVIKNKIDFSFNNNEMLFDKDDYLKNIYFKNSTYRKISKSLILNIAKARLEEIFKMIKTQLNLLAMNSTIENNFFIVGGGSNLFNLDEYFANYLKLKVKKLVKYNDKFEENFTSCLGALKIITDGWETEAIPQPINENTKKISFFSRIFGSRG